VSNSQDWSKSHTTDINQVEDPISNRSNSVFSPTNTNYQKFTTKFSKSKQKKMLEGSSRNKVGLSSSNSNHLRSTPKRIFTQRAESTVSVKDLINRENLMKRLSESNSGMFPALSGKGRCQNKDQEPRKRSICSIFSPPPIHQPKLFDFSKKKHPVNEGRYGSNLKLSRGQMGSESTPNLVGSQMFSPNSQKKQLRYIPKNSFKTHRQAVSPRGKKFSA
jgi:hypothetical protein